MGTVHVLEAARLTPSMKAVINVFSDKRYENNEWPGGYRETDPLGGTDPYSASKDAAELVTAAYPARSLLFRARRPGTGQRARRERDRRRRLGRGPRGPGHSAHRSPGAGSHLAATPTQCGPGSTCWSPLCGYLLLGSRLGTEGPTFAEAWNCGSGDESVVMAEELAERLVEAWRSDALALKLGAAASQPHEDTLLKLDISKVHTRLDWQPVLRFRIPCS